MSGTLLLDLDTVLSAPKFFSVLALVERAAGRQIVVVDANSERKGGEKLAAGLGIPMTKFVHWNGITGPMSDGDVNSAHDAKTKVARNCRAHAPVIWVDQDFEGWQGPDLSKLDNIVALNWKMVLRQGSVGVDPGLA